MKMPPSLVLLLPDLSSGPPLGMRDERLTFISLDMNVAKVNNDHLIE
jgi:hypothetical protein